MIKILYNIFMILLIITEGLLSIISIFVVQKNPGLVFGMMMVLLSFLIIQLIGLRLISRGLVTNLCNEYAFNSIVRYLKIIL